MIDYTTLEVDGIDTSDYPDFSDAFISGGYYLDGTPIPDDVLEKLSDDGYLVHELVLKKLY